MVCLNPKQKVWFCPQCKTRGMIIACEGEGCQTLFKKAVSEHNNEKRNSNKGFCSGSDIRFVTENIPVSKLQEIMFMHQI